jgi:hypothetical protein
VVEHRPQTGAGGQFEKVLGPPADVFQQSEK